MPDPTSSASGDGCDCHQRTPTPPPPPALPHSPPAHPASSASAVQCVLSKDYVGLVQAFIDTGFVGSPIEWRPKDGDPWERAHPSGESTTLVMAKELRDRMESVSGGGSRFGALSTVLGDMGFNWLMYTPPCARAPAEPRARQHLSLPRRSRSRALLG